MCAFNKILTQVYIVQVQIALLLGYGEYLMASVVMVSFLQQGEGDLVNFIKRFVFTIFSSFFFLFDE